MSAEFHISPDQIEQISKALEISVDRLENLMNVLEASRSMKPQDLQKEMADALGSPEEGKLLCKLLLGWRGLSFEITEPIDEVFSAIRTGVVRGVGGDSDLVAKFDERKVVLLKLLQSPSVRRVAKVLTLSYEYPNLFKSARIISDIRPVYDESGDAFSEAVISHTLSLKYNSGDDERALSLVLDLNDLQRLLGQCQRGLKKAHAAKKFMTNAQICTVISGEEETKLSIE